LCNLRIVLWRIETCAELSPPMATEHQTSCHIGLGVKSRSDGFPRPVCRRTGNLTAVRLLLWHRKIESTVRYLGIEVDDA
jgi:hypothetical protein